MEEKEEPRLTSSRVSSPLGLVSLFFGLAELALGYASSATSGIVQVSVLTFMALFATGVAGTFFYILWHRNWVFYPPSDFPGASVAHYVAAMRSGEGKEFVGPLTANVSRAFDEAIGGVEKVPNLASRDDKNIRGFLQELRKDAIGQIRASVIRVDAGPLQGDGALQWEEIYDGNIPVQSFLDRIWWQLQPFAPYPYGTVWLLRDASSGKIYDEIGPSWAQQHEVALDSRTVQQVGITGGLTLEVISRSTA